MTQTAILALQQELAVLLGQLQMSKTTDHINLLVSLAAFKSK